MSNVFKTKGSGITEFRSIPLCYHRCQLKQVLLCVCSLLTHFWFFGTPWTVARQASLSMGFSRQEYWSRLPFPPLGDLPSPGIKLTSPAFPALADGCFTTEPPGKSQASIKPLLSLSGGQRGLACCSPWGGKHQTWLSSWTTTKPHLSKSAEIKFINV